MQLSGVIPKKVGPALQHSAKGKAMICARRGG